MVTLVYKEGCAVWKMILNKWFKTMMTACLAFILTELLICGVLDKKFECYFLVFYLPMVTFFFVVYNWKEIKGRKDNF